MLQWWGFQVDVIIELVLEIFEVEFLARRWWLAAEHVQAAAEGAEAKQGNHCEDGHTSRKRQLVEGRTQSLLGLQKEKISDNCKLTPRGRCDIMCRIHRTEIIFFFSLHTVAGN